MGDRSSLTQILTNNTVCAAVVSTVCVGEETIFQSVRPDFPGIICSKEQLVISEPKGHQASLNDS